MNLRDLSRAGLRIVSLILATTLAGPPVRAATTPTMIATRTGCRTIDDVLTIMWLADRSDREGGDLSSAQSALDAKVAAGACKVIKQGTPVVVADRQDRDSFPFVCLKPDGEGACYWISSFPTRLP